ncbi:winged helix-turn-helix transcriptional regulator [Streptomyces sp. ME02-6977A]|uniref:winged helix-turn-helix transcriptional regulator n=1 Tax=Streptomyces sp. ME02-6977A TaxID=3028671 RepID=UPI0029A60F0F|nr:winged helix-turn-helix transcriptional regulator [Streptomyces sp. ME02-6977A]MDX3405443.1 winged helix-turn-helix transcriptional regulator [Streptomyces sp. ME02-6977A]
MSPRRSYDQYCSAARALDAVGDRWTLLIVRELLAGPRRYTDLHADLPGVSTDVLASRLKDMEREGLVEVRLEEGDFHLYADARAEGEDGPVYGEGPAPGEPDARLVLDAVTCAALGRGETGLREAVRDGRVQVTGDGTVAKALREG